jgi:hypothetical protein
MACVAAAALCLCSPASAEVTRSGTLEAVVVDLRNGDSVTRYALKTPEGTVRVKPTALGAEHGDKVRVSGRMEDGRLVGQVETLASRAAEPRALGPRRVAVMLLSFGGGGASSPEAMRSRVFTSQDSANAFYTEESDGGISLTGKLQADGDVFGTFNVGASGGCQPDAWAAEANAAAAGEGINLSGYQHFVYVFPFTFNCQWFGQAQLGGTRAWINGGDITHVITHELGHNMGLFHAGSWSCTSGTQRVPISDTCTTSEYGDPFDAMGNSGYRHNSASSLAKLGILSAGEVQTVESDGTYNLRAAVSPAAGPAALRIPRTRAPNNNITSWYYLEIRQPSGFFEAGGGASTTGVSVRVVRPGQSPETLLLDGSVATGTYGDAPLAAGQSIDGGPVRIRTVTAGAGAATVAIEVDDTRDLQAPSTPENLAASVGAAGVRLDWTASTDNVGVARYAILRDGIRIGDTSSTTFIDRLASAGSRTYRVHAEDAASNRSDESDPATAEVPAVSGPTCTNPTCTMTYRYAGAPGTWTVPLGVTQATFTLEGAVGGSEPESAAAPGLGGRAGATLGSLSAGEAFTLTPGESGESAASGGGGGSGGGGDATHGGGGGGYTKLEREASLQLLAGGGGGVGLGGFDSTTGERTAGGNAGRGTATGVAGSAGGSLPASGATLQGGGGGQQGGSGGAGGAGGAVTGTTTCAGGASAGSAGAPGGSLTGGGGAADAGGGGGGGFAGGGQGGGGAHDDCGNTAGWGGGAGGSAYAAPGISATFTGTGNSGDGRIGISYPNPVAALPHHHSMLHDESLNVPAATGLLSSVIAPSGVPLTASLDIEPAHGSAAVNPDGSFTYAPDPGYAGIDSFFYRVSDPNGHGGTGKVNLTIAGPPSAAITAPASGTTFTIGQEVPTTFSCAEGAGGPGMFSCVDSNGLTTGAGGTGQLDTTALGTHTYSVTARSQSGLTGATSITYTVITEFPDPPTASISSPANGGSYLLGQVVPTQFTCAEDDYGPGLASCNDSNGVETEDGGSGQLSTSSAGTHTYRVTATSTNGLTSSASVTYTVTTPLQPKPPTAAISAPAFGATYTLGQHVPTQFICAEGLNGPGLASCSDSAGTTTAAGGAGRLDTSTTGPHTYTVTAKSQSGLTDSATLLYNVHDAFLPGVLPVVKPRPPKCRKGMKAKRVKGKWRCVRKKKKRPRASRAS